MRHLVFASRNPAFNLALEECLFKSLPPEHEGWFLLWQNDPSVIIGRHQDAAREVNLARAGELGIPVLRRVTGGGAVYHDSGNLNFSFIRPCREAEDFSTYLEPVCAALADIGVDARIGGRNDLTAGGGKISGSAQARSGGAILHHGTLLLHVYPERLGELLTPAKQKIARHGVASVAARVAGIAALWREGSSLALLRERLLARCAPEAGSLPPKAEDQARRLALVRYGSPQWNLGRTRQYDRSRREFFPWGQVEVRIGLREGRIELCDIRGDFFADGDIADLEKLIEGQRPGDLGRSLAGLDWQNYFRGCDPGRMLDLFASLA